VRYNSNGSLDTSFSADGKVTTNFNFSNTHESLVTLQSDGKIVLGGTRDDNFAQLSYKRYC